MSDPKDAVAQALRLHGDLCTRGNADYLAEVLVAELTANGWAPERYEYTLGWQADNGNWCRLGRHETHPWLSEMQRQLAEHEGDPDWAGVVVIRRPVFDWAPALSPTQKEQP